MIKDKLYSFIFAGQLKTGKYIEKKTLYDGVVVYKFTDGITIYPIKKENICGNSKR
jgi:hypothetical protein